MHPLKQPLWEGTSLPSHSMQHLLLHKHHFPPNLPNHLRSWAQSWLHAAGWPSSQHAAAPPPLQVARLQQLSCARQTRPSCRPGSACPAGCGRAQQCCSTRCRCAAPGVYVLGGACRHSPSHSHQLPALGPAVPGNNSVRSEARNELRQEHGNTLSTSSQGKLLSNQTKQT
jgi:hypothetical protein